MSSLSVESARLVQRCRADLAAPHTRHEQRPGDHGIDRPALEGVPAAGGSGVARELRAEARRIDPEDSRRSSTRS